VNDFELPDEGREYLGNALIRVLVNENYLKVIPALPDQGLQQSTQFDRAPHGRDNQRKPHREGWRNRR
jgi:hypothetical protein